MPARPYVPGVCKVVLGGTIGPHNWAIVLHCQYTGTAPTAAQLDTLATDIRLAWHTSYAGLVSTTVILTSVTITDIASATGNQGVDGTAVPGTAGAAVVGGNSAVLVNYPSSFRYRGGHPRTYLPAPPDNQLNDASHISGTYQGTVVTGWNAVLAPLYGTSIGTFTTGGQCAVSYVTDKAPRAVPVVMPISQTAITVETQLASQRRRIGRK